MSEKPQIVLAADKRLPTDKFILEGLDVSRQPLFTISEVAKFFFGRTTHWLRWREPFMLDGKEVGTRRTETHARVYALDDVEKMAHALAEAGDLTGDRFEGCLLAVEAVAKVWGYLSTDEKTTTNGSH